MTNKLKQDLKERMIFLPQESQEVINSFDWEKICEEIGKKYFLTEEDISMLQANVGLTLVGLQEQDALAMEVEDDAMTSKNHAEKIADEVVEKILKPIYQKISEKIKNNLSNKPIHWQQNLYFILSGGDYTAFIRDPEQPEIKVERGPSINTKFDDSKIDDLKSSFTI